MVRRTVESEARLQTHDEEVDSRERAVPEREKEIVLSHTKTMLQIEANRANLWKHVCVMSTDVAEDVQALRRFYRAVED